MTNLAGFFTCPVAETALGGILSLVRGIDELARLKTGVDWQKDSLRKRSQLLKDATVVMVGFGSINRRLAKLLKPFDCHITTLRSRSTTANLEALLPDTDVVVCGAPTDSIRMYGSGGCCDAREHFRRELSMLHAMGINLYKIRAVKHDILRTAWILEEASKHGIEIGVDMCQNLAQPAQLVEDVVAYVEIVHKLTDKIIVFLEEAIGPANPKGFKALRERVKRRGNRHDSYGNDRADRE